MTGSELRSLRKKRDISQVGLARLLKVTPPTVCNWESGQNPIPANRVSEIEKVLQCETAKGGTKGPTCESNPQKSETLPENPILGEMRATGPIEVRICHAVELGPETMKALKDMIDAAVRAMKAETIRPEVIASQREGDRYRGKTQTILGRGW